MRYYSAIQNCHVLIPQKLNEKYYYENHYAFRSTKLQSDNQCEIYYEIILKRLLIGMNYDVKSLTLRETRRCGRNSKRKMLCILSNRRKAFAFLFVGLVTRGKTFCRGGCIQGRFLKHFSFYKLHVVLSILLSKLPIFISIFRVCKCHSTISFMKIQRDIRINIRNSWNVVKSNI